MKNFLQEHEREVVDMVNFEWNQKDFEEAIREDTFKKATGTEEKELFLVDGATHIQTYCIGSRNTSIRSWIS